MYIYINTIMFLSQILFLKSVLLKEVQQIFRKQVLSSLLLDFSVSLSKQYLQRYVLCIDSQQEVV